MELGIVALNVMFNQWTNRFYNALQEYQWDTFVAELLWFCMLATIFIVLAVYQLYLNQWLQIRWRRWMTVKYLGGWLDVGNHYRMQLVLTTRTSASPRTSSCSSSARSISAFSS
jgi:putative ATP-binding cassette transporter